MPEKVYEVKIKIQGTKDYLKSIKENIYKIFTEEVSPEMYTGIKDIFLYRKMPTGFSKKIDTFMSAHAGLFSAAIIKNMKTAAVNFTSNNTNATLQPIAGREPELVLSFVVSKEFAEKFEQANKDEEAIYQLVTGLDNATAKRIFDESLKEMENK